VLRRDAAWPWPDRQQAEASPSDTQDDARNARQGDAH